MSPTSTPSTTPSSSPTISCGLNEVRFKLILVTDIYPSETSWELLVDDSSNQLIASGGGYTEETQTYEEIECLANDGFYNFTIFDSYGDGLCCSGSYSIELDGVVVGQGGGDFGFSESIQFDTILTP